MPAGEAASSHFEVAAVLLDEGIAGSLAATFQADLQHSVEYRLQLGQQNPVWQRLSEATARLLSPLL